MERHVFSLCVSLLALAGPGLGGCVLVDKEVGSDGDSGAGESDSEGEPSAALGVPPEQLWSQDDPGMNVESVAAGEAGGVFIAGTLEVVTGTGLGVAVLESLSPADGSVLWSRTLEGPEDHYSVRVMSYQTDVLAVWDSHDSPLRAARYSADGDLIWSTELVADDSWWLAAAVVDAGGQVAIAGRSGGLDGAAKYAFVSTVDANNGAPGWTWSSDAGAEEATAVGYIAQGTLAVVIQDGLDDTESYVIALGDGGVEESSFALPTQPYPAGVRGIASLEGGPALLVGHTRIEPTANVTSWLGWVSDGGIAAQETNVAEQTVWNMAFEVAAVQGGFIVAGKVIEDPGAPLQGWLGAVDEDGTPLWTMTDVPGVALAIGGDMIVTGARGHVEARSF